MQVTIKDIAKEVGVTHGVVSRVLNGGSSTVRVSAQTAARIQEVADRLGYRRNAVAGNFRENRTRMIGILHGDGFPRLRFDGGSGYFAQLMDGIVDGAFRHGYTVGLCPHLIGDESGKAIADGRFDGYIWYCGGPYPDAQEVIARCPFPMVVIHTPASELGGATPTVLCDNGQGIRLALEHLRALGHSRVGFALNFSYVFAESRIRRDLFLSVAQELEMIGSLINVAFGVEPIIEQWKEHLPVTAVMAHNEELAGKLMTEAQSVGIRVPQDLSFIGFDSTYYCDLQLPPLTCVSQPLDALGRAAVERLVQLLNGETEIPIQTLLPCGLDVRASTAPPR